MQSSIATFHEEKGYRMTKIMSFQLFIVTLTMISMAPAFSASAKKSVKKTPKKTKNWSVSLGASINTSLHKNTDLDKRLSSDFSLSPSYRFSNGLRMGTSLSGSKDLLNEREWNWNNSYLSFSKGLTTFNKIKLSGLALVHIPLSEYSRDYQKLITGLMVAPIFSYNFANVGIDRLSMSYRPSFTKYFHEFTTSLLGGSNTEYNLSQRLGLNFTISDAAYFGLTGTYSRSYTYQGNERDSYSFVSSLGYSPTPKSSVEIGHSNGGSPLATNGRDIEIEVFNNRESTVFMAFGYQF